MRRGHRAGGVAGLLVSLVLSGCSGAQPHQNSPSSPSAVPAPHGATTTCGAVGLPERAVTVAALLGKRFEATAYDDCGVTRHLAAGTRFTLTFTAKVPGMRGPQLGYGTGCNGGGGGVAIRESRLEVIDLVTTLRGCPDPRGRQQDVLTRLLESSPYIAWRVGRLVLRTDEVEIEFREVGRASLPKSFETPR